MANKVSNKAKNAHLGRKAIRMAGGAVLGATAGTVALAAGIAGGDPSKTMQYTAAGMAGGYKLGSSITDKASNAITVSGTMDKAREYYRQGDPDYEEKQIKKAQKAAQKDYDLRMKAEAELGSKKAAKQFMENDVIEYAKHGVAKEEMLAVKKLENAGYNQKEAMSIALTRNIYADGKDTRILGSKSSEDLNKTIENRFTKNMNDENEKNEKVQHIRDGMDLFSKFLYDNKS